MCFSLLGDSKVSATSPLSPSELLVALHQIEAKSDMKSVMKGNPVRGRFRLDFNDCSLMKEL